MLGALGALIRKDERTLFNKSSDGLYISAPKLEHEKEEEFIEDLGYLIKKKLLKRWPFDNDIEWVLMRSIFEQSRLRILYTSEESHEWILYTNNMCFAGVYQKFNFEFGDGKFHDIISMGTTTNIAWNVKESNKFHPSVLCNVGQILNMNKNRLPFELWHIILEYSIDCFTAISQMMEVDIVLRDVRRWTQNLYLSENLHTRDEFGDANVKKFGQIFIEIGSEIDAEYVEYRKQFSIGKKIVKFFKKSIFNMGQIQISSSKNNTKKKPKTNHTYAKSVAISISVSDSVCDWQHIGIVDGQQKKLNQKIKKSKNKRNKKKIKKNRRIILSSDHSTQKYVYKCDLNYNHNNHNNHNKCNTNRFKYNHRTLGRAQSHTLDFEFGDSELSRRSDLELEYNRT